jgi:hypothetical protein
LRSSPSGDGPLAKVTVGYDHATHSEDEHAVLIDFTNNRRPQLVGAQHYFCLP